jgi:hypothetical protein
MMVRRVRRPAGSQLGDVHFDRRSGVSFAAKDMANAARFIGRDWQILEAIELRTEGGALPPGLRRSQQGKQTYFPA